MHKWSVRINELQQVEKMRVEATCGGVALVAVVEADVNARRELQNLLKSEPCGIERTKFFFCFLEHPEISVALDSEETAHVLRVLQTNRSDDDPTHNSSGAFDEIGEAVLQSQSRPKRKMPSRKRGTAFVVDVQQRLNCALPSRVSLGSGFFRFQSLHGISASDDQLIHPRELAVDLFNRASK